MDDEYSYYLFVVPLPAIVGGGQFDSRGEAEKCYNFGQPTSKLISLRLS